MLTRELLDLVREHLAAVAPWRAGRQEYLAGVNDTVAAAKRLAAEEEATSTATEGTVPNAGNTGLVMEYLRLELAGLLRLIDDNVGRPGTTIADNDHELRGRLRHARHHLDAAMQVLRTQ